MRFALKMGEALVSWGLIYFGLWIATDRWGFAISEEWWKVTLLIVCLIIARTSAYEYGKWEAGQFNK